jgi:hypothetical protein
MKAIRAPILSRLVSDATDGGTIHVFAPVLRLDVLFNIPRRLIDVEKLGKCNGVSRTQHRCPSLPTRRLCPGRAGQGPAAKRSAGGGDGGT